jgi:formylmethanofuran dehydrogenase subunit E
MQILKSHKKRKHMAKNYIPGDLAGCVDFHGHLCPGLVIGYLASKIGMGKMRGKRAEDEELLCIVMSDGCAVDAVQYVTGCTLGKGNLIFQDYGKMVFIFLSRTENKPARGVRLSFQAPPSMKKMKRTKNTTKEKVAQALLTMPVEKLFSITRLRHYSVPERAKIFPSQKCSVCGELAMEPRLSIRDGKLICRECAPEIYSRGW